METLNNENHRLENAESSSVDERRLKIISIDKKLFIDFLNWWRNPPGYIALPITEELPSDCVVVSVSASWEKSCIEALVASSSFPPLQAGEAPERVPGVLTEFRLVNFE